MSDLNLRELVIRHGCKCGAWWVLPGDMKATDHRGGWHWPNEPGAPDCKPAAIQTPEPFPPNTFDDLGPLEADQREYAEPQWDPLKTKVFVVAVAVLLVIYILLRGAYR